MSKTSPVSLLASLKRKVMYQVYSLVNDPNANAFAEENASDNPGADDSMSTLFSTPKTDSIDVTTEEEPIHFTSNEKMNRVLNRMYGILKKSIVPFVCLLLSMYVANEMIVYSAPIRAIFFVFTFAICFLFRPFMILLAAFYIGKKIYHIYVNKIAGGEPRRIMPKIFALLPLTTTQPVSALMSFIMYPFTYPKTDKDAEKLKEVMKEYMDTLTGIFPYFDKVKDVPVFAEGWTRIQDWSEHLHDVPEVKEEAQAPMPAVLETPKSNTTNTGAPMPAVLGAPKSNTTNTGAPMPAVLGAPMPAVLEAPKSNTSINGTPPPALGASKSNNGTPPPALGAPKSNNGTPPPALGAPKSPANGTPPPTLGAPKSNNGTPPPALGAPKSNNGTPPALGAPKSPANGTPPPALGAPKSNNGTPPALGAPKSPANGTPPPALGAPKSNNGTPPPALGTPKSNNGTPPALGAPKSNNGTPPALAPSASKEQSST